MTALGMPYDTKYGSECTSSQESCNAINYFLMCIVVFLRVNKGHIALLGHYRTRTSFTWRKNPFMSKRYIALCNSN